MNLPKYKITNVIGVSTQIINSWEREGVPVRIKPYVMSVLKNVLFEKKSERSQNLIRSENVENRSADT